MKNQFLINKNVKWTFDKVKLGLVKVKCRLTNEKQNECCLTKI